MHCETQLEVPYNPKSVYKGVDALLLNAVSEPLSFLHCLIYKYNIIQPDTVLDSVFWI